MGTTCSPFGLGSSPFFRKTRCENNGFFVLKMFWFFSILVLAIGMTSCSDEENKIQNQVAARPSVPVLDTEVRIGNQIWMTRNLNVSKYRNGDPIPQVTDPTQWANLTTGAWCYYNNGAVNGAIYGKLYNWYAVNDPRGLAPVGWHVPSDAEWTVLITFLGGGSAAGGKMKAIAGWNAPNNNATNSSGFTALPGGDHSGFGPFDGIGDSTSWWSSSAYNATNTWVRFVSSNDALALRYNLPNDFGVSVRCIKD
jgi:uncharacterized protein (TIGR02145 family)